MRTARLDAPFGLRLELDGQRLLTPDEGREIRQLLLHHGLLVVRNGEITPDRQIELLSTVGRVEPDETGRPMRMEVTNQHDQSTAPDGELVFHFDYAYDPTPIPAISMYGAVVGEGATPTLFASSAEVLSRLEPARRWTLLLREVEEMSYEEIAVVTGVAVGTVRSRLARARDDLRKLLGVGS